MTPRAVRQQIADLATTERDAALRRIRNLRSEIAQLESYAAQMDTVTRVVGVRTEPLALPNKALAESMIEPDDMPEFVRDTIPA